ncbi:hypothetical protein QYE76_047324 [Lolium multiflorum]|uniref:Uncharacterized protein n=1 Tax=Lolium multiflorum TaxID=4521 RepID=A0AAD8X1I0_LOLMU|nr:hypothetical protein QYE76_047324 [Lolium multiflorum]
MASIVYLTPREAEALCASNYPCPPGYRVPTGWLLSVGGVPVPPVPLGVAREMAITNHYYFELTPEQRRNPQWHPDYSPTWESFFINRRERALARHEEGGPPPSNFNEAGRRLWWRGRTLQGVMAYRGPRLRYPQSQPTRALPPRFDYRDPDASDDDDGDYDDYSGEYYRARHERARPRRPNRYQINAQTPRETPPSPRTTPPPPCPPSSPRAARPVATRTTPSSPAGRLLRRNLQLGFLPPGLLLLPAAPPASGRRLRRLPAPTTPSSPADRSPSVCVQWRVPWRPQPRPPTTCSTKCATELPRAVAVRADVSDKADVFLVAVTLLPGYAAYAASKAAVEAMLRVTSTKELGTRVTVNCVAPGPWRRSSSSRGRAGHPMGLRLLS